MNRVTLVGRLTQDPVLRYTSSENSRAVCDFTIAVNRRIQRDKTDFIRIVCWSKTAENVANYLKKGSQCAVSGSIQTGSYTDKNGITRRTFDILADEVEFIGGSAQRQSTPSQYTQEPHTEVQRDDLEFFDEEEIPF